MKIALLSAANDIHTARWANGLVSRGHNVELISVHPSEHELDSRVKFHHLSVKAPFGYLFSAIELRRILNRIKPDILNAHYATGYGLLARLSGFKPLLLSVWGMDVYSFPNKSLLHRILLKNNLKNATAIGSTSHVMAKETAKTFKHENVFVTPFGIDEGRFTEKNRSNNQRRLTIGTVKKLEKKYGIDLLIKAFHEAYNFISEKNKELAKTLNLVIIGKGPEYSSLQKLVKNLGIADKVEFKGFVPHNDIPKMLHEMDIFMALSRYDSESFGVAILEANLCGLPVIVSDADGLKEVTINKETAFVVPKESVSEASQVMVKLILSESLREKMGKAGRNHVLKNYTWTKSLDIMINALEETVILENK